VGSDCKITIYGRDVKRKKRNFFNYFSNGGRSLSKKKNTEKCIPEAYNQWDCRLQT
jgi:hypothetical protein